jgi:plastocyanin
MNILRSTAIIGLLPTIAVAASLQVMIDGRATVFSDVPSDAWFAVHVKSAAEAGVVSGYKNANGTLTGRFGPSNFVTVGEALKIASEGAGYDETTYGAGVTGHWAVVYLPVATAEGFDMALEKHRSAEGFDAPATRAEVASLIAGAFKVTHPGAISNRYTDVNASTPYADAIEALSLSGIIGGDTDAQGNFTGTFRPNERINRAEVVKIIMNARGSYGLRTDGPLSAGVTYTEEGFDPPELRVKAGTTVVFANRVSEAYIASDPHPTHTDLPEFQSGLLKFSGYSFIFTEKGTWGYHNHLKPSHRGTIIVE